MVDFFNENSGFATSLAAFLAFLATLALVVVTLIYTRHTRRLAEVSKEPDIQPWLYVREARVMFLRVINCGTGAAIDVETEISYSNAGGSVVWTWPFMGAGQMYEFRFINPETSSPVYSPDELRALGRMRFCAKYKVSDGREWRELGTTHDIDLERVLQSSMDAQMMVTRDQPDKILLSIRDEIEKLHK